MVINIRAASAHACSLNRLWLFVFTTIFARSRSDVNGICLHTILNRSEGDPYKKPLKVSPPAPGTWGDHPPLPSPPDLAMAARRHGKTLKSAIGFLGRRSSVMRNGKRV
jgi:hypothetical protein